MYTILENNEEINNRDTSEVQMIPRNESSQKGFQ